MADILTPDQIAEIEARALHTSDVTRPVLVGDVRALLAHVRAVEAERDAAVARAARLEKALRAHLHTSHACSHPVGGEGSIARRNWEDQCAADQMARAALGQEAFP